MFRKVDSEKKRTMSNLVVTEAPAPPNHANGHATDDNSSVVLGLMLLNIRQSKWSQLSQNELNESGQTCFSKLYNFYWKLARHAGHYNILLW